MTSRKGSSSRYTDKILFIGVAALDTIATIKSFPKPDDKIRSESILISGGGNAANTAVAFSRMSSSFLAMSCDVDLLSAVGNDVNGNTICNDLLSQGVGLERIQRYSGVSSWCYVMVVSSGPQQNTRTCVFQSGSTNLSVEHIKHNLLGSTSDGLKDDSGHLRGYSAAHFDGRHIEASVYLARLLVRLDIPYSVDVERPRGEGLLELLHGATIVICNSRYCNLTLGLDEQEEGELDEKETVANLRKILKEQAPQARIGVSTLGSRGSVLIILGEENTRGDIRNKINMSECTDEENIVLERHCRFPDSPRVVKRHGALWCDAWKSVDVIDTTGAGDVFQGGFLATLWSCAGMERQRHERSFKRETYTNKYDTVHSPLQLPLDTMTLAHALRIGTRVAGLKLNGLGSRAAFPSTDTFLELELKALQL